MTVFEPLRRGVSKALGDVFCLRTTGGFSSSAAKYSNLA